VRFPKLRSNTGYFSQTAPLTLFARFLEYKSRERRHADAELFRPAWDRIMATAPDPKQQRRMLTLAYSASSTLTGPALLGLLIDWLAGTMPWFTVGGVLVGMAGLFVLLIRFAQPQEPRP
jgi:F0F1-type ATP synthase assembly protein I